MKILFALLSICRPINLLILVATQFVITYYIFQLPFQFPHLIPYILLAVSSASLTAGGYVVNDLYDMEIDHINKPHKQRIGKEISQKKAWQAYFVLSGISLLVSGLLGWQLLLLHTVVGILLYLYAIYLKKTPLFGNMLVALLSALGGLLPVLILLNSWRGEAVWQENTQIFLFIFLYSFLLSLLREIIKDLQDIEGDKIGNCKTLPIILGITTTKKVVLLLWLFMILLSLFYFTIAQNKNTPPEYAVYGYVLKIYLIGLVIVAMYMIYSTWQAKTKKKFGALSLACKILILSGILIIPVLRFL
jgi:4-hydroxybenzoate polyprenyltransferase